MTYLTEIAKENYEYYAPLFPPFIMKDVAAEENSLIFGIESEELPAGAAAVRLLGPQAEIFWFYLDDSFRGMGIGKESFYLLLEYLKDSLDIEEVAMEIDADADPGLKNLFKGREVRYRKLPQCRFETTVGWMRSAKRLMSKAKNCSSLLEVNDRELRGLSATLTEMGLDLVPMPIVKEHYMADCSAVFAKDGKPAGLMLLKKTEEGVEIAYLAAISKDPSALLEMMRFVREKTIRLGDGTPLFMNLVDERLKKLVQMLLNMEEEEEDDFVYNVRAVLPLDFLTEAREDAELVWTLWEEL